MSQIDSNFDRDKLTPEHFVPGSAPAPKKLNLSSAEVEEIVREVRERRAENPDPKRYSTKEVLEFAASLAKSQEDA